MSVASRIRMRGSFEVEDGGAEPVVGASLRKSSRGISIMIAVCEDEGDAFSRDEDT